MKAKSFLRALLFFLTLLTFFMSVLIASLPDEVGAIDFRPYWSASYLFARDLDFGDLQALDHIEDYFFNNAIPASCLYQRAICSASTVVSRENTWSINHSQPGRDSSIT